MSDHKTLEPAPVEAKKLVAEMLTRNVLLSTDGPHNNVIKIKPPMVITIEDVNLTLKLLDDVLSNMK